MCAFVPTRDPAELACTSRTLCRADECQLGASLCAQLGTIVHKPGLIDRDNALAHTSSNSPGGPKGVRSLFAVLSFSRTKRPTYSPIDVHEVDLARPGLGATRINSQIIFAVRAQVLGCVRGDGGFGRAI